MNFRALEIGALTAVASVGCLKQAPAPVSPVVTRDEHQAYEAQAPVAQRSCADAGPFSCDLPPSAKGELCAHLAKCISERDASKAGLQVSGCGELSEFEPAPEASGVAGIAVVNVDGTLNGEVGQGSYLVAQHEDGYCLVDQAVKWASTKGGYLDTDSRMAWRTVGGRTLLSVQTQAVRFQQEGAEEEENDAQVLGAFCRDAEYALAAGRFRAVSERPRDEPCDDE